jgi:hypothetical protein
VLRAGAVTASFCTAAATGAASFTVLRVKIFHGWNRANPTATPTTATTATVIQMAFFRLRGLLGGRVSRPVIALSWVGAVEMQVGCSIRRPDGVRRKQVCSHYETLTLLAQEDRERVGARWTDHGLNSLAGRSASAVTTSHLRFRGFLVACLDGGAKLGLGHRVARSDRGWDEHPQENWPDRKHFTGSVAESVCWAALS